MIPQSVWAPLVRYLIGARVADPRPIDVQNLYRAVDGDSDATAWLDRRFVDRELPPGWREIEREIDELAFEASEAGIPLDRVTGDLIDGDDPDPLARLRCLIKLGLRRHPPTTEPLPEGKLGTLDDLIEPSRRRIELFAIEEGFHFGLPPIETLQLYDDVESDPRALQYLNRRFDLGEEPEDLAALRGEARDLAERYESLGYLPSMVLGEQCPRTGDRSMREILTDLEGQLANLGGPVGAI